MVAKRVETKIKLEPEVDLDLKRWADEEDRSKCRHMAVLLRRLSALRRTKREVLRDLQLV